MKRAGGRLTWCTKSISSWKKLTLNIMNYGYTDEAVHLIEVSVKTEDSRITIEIVDDGRPFNPIADAPMPDLEGPMMDRRIGGWGVHIVRTIMDDVSYVRVDNKNQDETGRQTLATRLGC